MHTERAELGQNAEDVAAEFLQRQGFELVARNYRRRSGELDVIARKDDVLVIVEVRTRSSDSFGGAAASIDGWKQHKIIRAATQLLQQRPDLAKLRARFDVIVVHDVRSAQPRVEWLQHAFHA
ncbi:MAG: YraN family protein [Gammaproteobacteria bacterium]